MLDCGIVLLILFRAEVLYPAADSIAPEFIIGGTVAANFDDVVISVGIVVS